MPPIKFILLQTNTQTLLKLNAVNCNSFGCNRSTVVGFFIHSFSRDKVL